MPRVQNQKPAHHRDFGTLDAAFRTFKGPPDLDLFSGLVLWIRLWICSRAGGGLA